MKILIAGDTVPNTNFDFSEDFIQLLNQHELKICNLEGSLSRNNNKIHKAGPCVLLIEKYVEKLAQYFNVFTLANNHSMDYQEEGLLTTITKCQQLGVGYCGADVDLAQAIQPYTYEDVSIISVAENEFGAAQDNKPGFASVEYGNEIYQTIRHEKQLGQTVIVVVHGGSEIIPIPPPYFRNRLQMYSSYGADLVVGNHPHVPQGSEKNVYYSLGNFIFLSADFSQYFNHDWSVVLSCDNTDLSCTPYFTTVQNGVVQLVDKQKEFKMLCDAISSPDYENLYTNIANMLYPSWYGELQTNAHAYLLHHIRCDGHKNIVQRALAHRIGEYDTTTKRFNITRKDSDSVYMEKTQP